MSSTNQMKQIAIQANKAKKLSLMIKSIWDFWTERTTFYCQKLRNIIPCVLRGKCVLEGGIVIIEDGSSPPQPYSLF